MNLHTVFHALTQLWCQKNQIKHWRMALQLDKHEPIYQQLFSTVDGFALSHQARAAQDAIDYTYGEIDFISFIALLSLVKPNQQTIFYDLGSGIGTAVLATAMVYPVKKSIGIEYFTSLHQAALQQKKRLNQYPDYQHTPSVIDFIQGDFLTTAMLDATLIFFNSTAFFGETWDKLNHRLTTLPHLEIVITLSKPLHCAAFIVRQKTLIQMSWGRVYAYINQRD